MHITNECQGPCLFNTRLSINVHGRSGSFLSISKPLYPVDRCSDMFVPVGISMKDTLSI